MKRLHSTFLIAILMMLFFVFKAGTPAMAQDATQTTPDMIALGKAIYFDASLSMNGAQSCATCHAPAVGFTGPDSNVNASSAIYQGALPNHFGNRKPPTAAYAGDSPELYNDSSVNDWFGGMFYDGRATGWTLHDPLAEQAQSPFLNPLEHALPNAQTLCVKVKQAEYASLFEKVWGANSLNCAKNLNEVYEQIGHSIAAYESSPEVSSFTSKFDAFWDAAKAAHKDVTKIKCGLGGGMMGGGAMGCPGGGMDPNRWTMFRNLGLSDDELQGLAMFNNRANCSSCHSLQPGSAGYPLFTDFGYDNIGMPKNPDNPFYSMPTAWNADGANWVDYGLGGYLKNSGKDVSVYKAEMGKFKVPTLRNVDLRPSADFVKAYGHNGYFKSLADVVLFYHWRAMMDNGCMGGGMLGGMGCDGMSNMFPAPEVDQNRAALMMFPRPQVDNIVAFLKTLSDGYFQR